jgi:4-amino-4-deoxy-L-arabinose transferase-like glycosyltransferase
MSSTLFEAKNEPTVHTYWQTPLFFIVTGGWFRFVGFGLLQLRLVSVLFGLLCIVSWGMTARYLLCSQAAGLLAGGLVAADYFFLIGASHGRMDMMCAGFGAAAIAVYLNLRERSLGWALFLSHSLAAAAIFAHPTGVIYSSGLALLLLWWDRRRISISLLALLAAPYLAAGLAWGAYILQDPNSFVTQFFGNVRTNHDTFTPAHSTRNPLLESFRQEIVYRYMAPFGLGRHVGAPNRVKALVLFGYITGVFGILAFGRMRRQRRLAFISWFFLLSFFVITFLAPSKFSYYLPHTTTTMAVCFGLFLFSLPASQRGNRLWRIPAIAGVMLLNVLGSCSRIHQDLYHHSYLATLNAIYRNSPPQSVVIGGGELWFGLVGQRELQRDFDFGYASGAKPAVFVMDALFQIMHGKAGEDNRAAYEYGESLMMHSRLVYQDAAYRVFVPDASAFPPRSPSAPRPYSTAAPQDRP